MQPIIPFEPVRRDRIPAGDDWMYQIKWDGVRLVAYQQRSSELKLYNRKRRERTQHYPELTEHPFCSAPSFIVDGELIALAADGKPSFHEVMRRDGLRRMQRLQTLQREVKITYMIFDLLYVNDKWILSWPLEERLDMLGKIVTPNRFVQLVDSHPNGQALFDVIRDNDMEGIVCKQRGRPYEPGGKDERWVKVKNYGEIEAVIGGFTRNGNIANAVLVGLYNADGRLEFIGKVGTGKLTRDDWRQLTNQLTAMETKTNPFARTHPDMKNVYWVQPAIVVRVRYSEWRRHEGRLLRQPSIQEFTNTLPTDCRLENP